MILAVVKARVQMAVFTNSILFECTFKRRASANPGKPRPRVGRLRRDPINIYLQKVGRDIQSKLFTVGIVSP